MRALLLCALALAACDSPEEPRRVNEVLATAEPGCDGLVTGRPYRMLDQSDEQDVVLEDEGGNLIIAPRRCVDTELNQ